MKTTLLPFAVLAAFAPAVAAAQDAPAPAPAPSIAITQEEGFVPFRCPIENIRNAYSKLVDSEDTLVALAIEKQTLAICRQSQEALLRIAENENRLTELFEPIIAPTVVETVEPDPVEAPEPASTRPGRTIERAPSAAITEPEPVDGPENQDVDTADVAETIEVELAEKEAKPTPPPYDLAAVMKDPVGWKAMLVNENAIFTVRVGDRMDDGSVVATIARGKVELIDEDNNSFTLE